MQEEVSIFTFGKKAEEVGAQIQQRNGRQPSAIFNPQPKQAGDTFTMIARIMPFVRLVVDDKNQPVLNAAGNKQYIMSEAYEKNIISKWFYAPSYAGNTIWFDSPVNVGAYCPMNDMWSILYNNADPNVKGLSKMFNRKSSSTCYIQIINAPAYPDMNGKIVPFAVPFELEKFMQSMVNPTDDDRALGVTSVLPYDIINGYPLKISFKAEMVPGIDKPVRKWSVAKYDDPRPNMAGKTEAYFLVDGNWQFASALGEQKVLEHITSQETEDLNVVYGHHNADNETIYNLYRWICETVSWVPGMVDKVNANLYFKWCAERFANESSNAQPAAQTIEAPAAPAPQAPQAPQAPAAPAPEAPQAPQAPEAPAAPAPEAPQGQIGLNELPV